MKEFKIYVGLTSDHLTEVLHAGLKNDSIPETFPIKHVNAAGVYFPTRFIKVVPLSAHGQSFHMSIWHIALNGIADEQTVQRIRSGYDEYREATVLRHILKHLRQRRLLTPFQMITIRSGFQLEHPLLSQLHESIVLRGDWEDAERLLNSMSRACLFDEYIQSCQPHAAWKRLHGTDSDGDVPSPRGGHAMCMDPVNQDIYLLGGYDGRKSLDDFWMYSIKDDRWSVLSHGTSADQNAPEARSCHKMAFDTKTGSIYVLGRLNDADSNDDSNNRTPQPRRVESGQPTDKAYCSEFYRYHARGIDRGKWDFLSFDTAMSGGPPLMFDHQMVMDSEEQVLYVFGGRVLDGDRENVKYSGLYSYSVRTSKWKCLQSADSTSTSSQVIIPPRFGHSMVLEPITKTLYIFAGQREDKYLSDMYAFDIANGTATEIFPDFTAEKGPDACFTQRAVLDPSLKEIYMFCGLTRNAHVGSMTILQSESPNWVYQYHPRPGKWTQILSSKALSATSEPIEEPLPRYAHQVVYNPNTRTAYLHGGNAGLVGATSADGDGGTPTQGRTGGEKRLDDLWQMELVRPSQEEIIRRAKFRIRRQQFREMSEDGDPIKALNFLQSDVASVVDHKDPVESDDFRSLLTHLLVPAAAIGRTKTPPPLGDHEDSPPRKRSRSTSPEDQWTSTLDEVECDSDGEEDPTKIEFNSPQTINARMLKTIQDPLERDDGSGVSAERFDQRNEVFESLLTFVGDYAKEPTGSLLDMVDGDGGL
ncbi:galactose oxidase [Pluteus cervinus]|uniref:Galactose oxidase n=1 Tax=Pluteus cervinus TaxID=181527 RepID=A0ACD3APY9_9AGAR|nr:galactose oxidase [Pluteus cervinus]